MEDFNNEFTALNEKIALAMLLLTVVIGIYLWVKKRNRVAAIEVVLVGVIGCGLLWIAIH